MATYPSGVGGGSDVKSGSGDVAVTQDTEGSVASDAEKSPETLTARLASGAAGVVMVDGEIDSGTKTDRTPSALTLEGVVVLLLRDTHGSFEVVLPVVGSPALSTDALAERALVSTLPTGRGSSLLHGSSTTTSFSGYACQFEVTADRGDSNAVVIGKVCGCRSGNVTTNEFLYDLRLKPLSCTHSPLLTTNQSGPFQ